MTSKPKAATKEDAPPVPPLSATPQADGPTPRSEVEPPAPMEIGAPLNKATINAQLGTAAQSFKRGLDAMVNMNDWSLAYTTEMLVALGFTEEEATILKSGLGEIIPVDNAVSATSWLKRFWGTGV